MREHRSRGPPSLLKILNGGCGAGTSIIVICMRSSPSSPPIDGCRPPCAVDFFFAIRPINVLSNGPPGSHTPCHSSFGTSKNDAVAMLVTFGSGSSTLLFSYDRGRVARTGHRPSRKP